LNLCVAQVYLVEAGDLDEDEMASVQERFPGVERFRGKMNSDGFLLVGPLSLAVVHAL
jgi:hypothetical protein